MCRNILYKSSSSSSTSLLSLLLHRLLLFYLIIFLNWPTPIQTNSFCNTLQRFKFRTKEFISWQPDSVASRTKRDVDWSVINEEVDAVIPLVLQHLHKMKVEQFNLPDIKQKFSLSPLINSYNPVLYLTNGIVYNLSGIKRYGPAFMTYEDKSFLIRFYLNIENLQFEYDFILKLLPIDGFGKVIGSLSDTIIYLDLGIDVTSLKIAVFDFRLVQFQNLEVQLDETRFLRHLSGIFLTPITNLFKERVTTSISDNLKDQFQMVIDDFNSNDPLELRKFTKTVLGGLTKDTKQNETS